MTFTLAMVKNPRVWKRAQAEIDAVLGIDRLPEFEDRQSLPYVAAIMRETFRWKPVGPLGAWLESSFHAEVYPHAEGVAHATTSSDVYNGFYVPKGMLLHEQNLVIIIFV